MTLKEWKQHFFNLTLYKLLVDTDYVWFCATCWWNGAVYLRAVTVIEIVTSWKEITTQNYVHSLWEWASALSWACIDIHIPDHVWRVIVIDWLIDWMCACACLLVSVCESVRVYPHLAQGPGPPDWCPPRSFRSILFLSSPSSSSSSPTHLWNALQEVTSQQAVTSKQEVTSQQDVPFSCSI